MYKALFLYLFNVIIKLGQVSFRGELFHIYVINVFIIPSHTMSFTKAIRMPSVEGFIQRTDKNVAQERSSKQRTPEI